MSFTYSVLTKSYAKNQESTKLVKANSSGVLCSLIKVGFKSTV